jgi:hypothetical protein
MNKMLLKKRGGMNAMMIKNGEEKYINYIL